MSLSSAGWQRQLLAKLGAPPTAQNLRFVNAWQQAEGGNASNNPFNTTQPGAGTSNYNSVGVKNYPSAREGLDATVQTLLNGRYGNIVGLLRSGKGTAQQEATAVAQSPWGTGSGVLRVLGAGPVNAAWGTPRPTGGKAGQGQNGLPPRPAPSNSANLMNQLLGETMLQNAQNTIDGNVAGGGQSLLQLVNMRNALQNADSLGLSNASKSASTHVASAANHGAGGVSPQIRGLNGSFGMQTGGKSPYSNLRFASNVDWVHINPRLLKAVNQAAVSHGVVADINSGYRSNKYTTQVGGFVGDPHTKGLAIDAYVNGKPIGAVIGPGVWKGLGVMSGDTPNFYHGAPDPEHLQLSA